MATKRKLNQVIAIEEGAKARNKDVQTAVYHKIQKPSLFSGETKSYKPLNENDPDVLATQVVRMQARAEECIEEVKNSLSELLDVTATKDWANCSARADVVFEGKTVLKEVPVTYLLFLEKRLVDLRTFISKLPVLDPAEAWEWSPNQNCYVTPVLEQARTKKVKSKIELAEATKEHPAQVTLVDLDERVGTYYTIKQSSALPAFRIKQLVDRIEKLQKSVKIAREEANTVEAPSVEVAQPIFDILFAP